MQGKGLRVEHSFFSHLERMQPKGMIRGQVRGRGLIEGNAPMRTGAKIEEALYDLLDCLRRAYRVPQYHSDLIGQAIVDHSVGSQKMEILREQAKECQAIPSVRADQFHFWVG